MDYWTCPECGSAFGVEEYDWQCCDACGWPDGDGTLFDDDDPDDDYPRPDERQSDD